MKHAFSLVELSIVLVILGLLTGGILAGQSLIKAAEQRNFLAQINRYSSAVLSFRDKYMALPGDMRNATAFWNAADGTTGLTASCLTSTAAGTCNGNGSGSVDQDPLTNTHEMFRFWQQMALAGLIEGTYTGVTGPLATTDVDAGVNIPTTKLDSSSIIAIRSLQTVGSSSVWFFPGSYGSVTFLIGRDTNGSNFNGDSSLLSNEVAWNIDSKMDDGRPGTGKVITMLNSVRPGCATSNDPSTAVYALTSTSSYACVLIIPSGI